MYWYLQTTVYLYRTVCTLKKEYKQNQLTHLNLYIVQSLTETQTEQMSEKITTRAFFLLSVSDPDPDPYDFWASRFRILPS
jgi:hypothetical protein